MKERYKPFIGAILYADIFDFPLTESEVWQFAIGKASKASFQQFIKNLPSGIKKINGYYCLANREAIVEKRLTRQKIGKQKLVIAKRIARLLQKIPTIQCIGISGGLSLLNADRKDDIDFFIIVTRNSIWVTRVLVATVLELLGKRRRRGDSLIANSICANMYLDEDFLAFPKKWHDLYLAHEVIQVMPLFSKANCYQRFLTANTWVASYLPNASERKVLHNYAQNNVESLLSKVLGKILSNFLLERSAKLLQKLYMQKHRTKEVISDTILAFHPVDYRGNTLKAFEKRLETL